MLDILLLAVSVIVLVWKAYTPGQLQTGPGPRVHPFTALACYAARIRC